MNQLPRCGKIKIKVLISHCFRGGISSFWERVVCKNRKEIIYLRKKKCPFRLLDRAYWLTSIFINFIILLRSKNDVVVSNDLITHIILCSLSRCRNKIKAVFMFHGKDFLSTRLEGFLITHINLAISKGAKIVFASDFLRKKYFLAGVHCEKSTVSHPINSIDFCVYSMKPDSNHTLKIVFIGHLNYQKGILEILCILRDLHRMSKLPPFDFTIVGDGEFFDYISSQDYPFKVHVAGLVCFDEVQEVLKGSDLLLLHPQEFEAFGRVAIEATLQGCQVLYSTVCATKEISVISSAIAADSEYQFKSLLLEYLKRERWNSQLHVKYFNQFLEQL